MSKIYIEHPTLERLSEIIDKGGFTHEGKAYEPIPASDDCGKELLERLQHAEEDARHYSDKCDEKDEKLEQLRQLERHHNLCRKEANAPNDEVLLEVIRSLRKDKERQEKALLRIMEWSRGNAPFGTKIGSNTLLEDICEQGLGYHPAFDAARAQEGV